MSQYFENDPSLKEQEKTISFSCLGKSFTLTSNTGVFSKDKLDTGSQILLETVYKEQKEPVHVLDLGCGIGSLSVVLSSVWNSAFTCVDINPRALQYAKRNMKGKGTFLCQDGIDRGSYDCIVCNPPIRAGKKVIYRLFAQAMEHCSGTLWIVIRKNHGAQSAMRAVESLGAQVTRVHREKGFWILKCTKDGMWQWTPFSSLD